MMNYEEEGFINVGTGEDISILELAGLIGEAMDYQGQIKWDSSKPDGTPRKLMDVSKMSRLGWTYTTGLREGILKVVKDFVFHGIKGL